MTALAGLLCSVVFIACGSNEVKSQASLTGRWELRKAFRNQKETGNLVGTYFKFGTDGTMETNLTGSEESAEFSLQKNEILQKGTPPIKYLIQASDDSSLVLITTMRGIEFELQLARAPEPAPVEEILPADSTLPAPEGDSTNINGQE